MKISAELTIKRGAVKLVSYQTIEDTEAPNCSHYMNASHIRNIKSQDDFPAFKMALAAVLFILAACAVGGLLGWALA